MNSYLCYYFFGVICYTSLTLESIFASKSAVTINILKHVGMPLQQGRGQELENLKESVSENLKCLKIIKNA